MRDLFMVGGICAVAIAIGIFLFFFGPSALRTTVDTHIETASASGPVPFTVLAQGDTALSITDRTNYRITNTNDLLVLWALVDGAVDFPKPPDVDFAHYEVLAFFDGSHSSGGYTMKVASINDENAVRTISIQHLAPDPSCHPPVAPDSPFIIVEVPKTIYSLAHVDTENQEPCPS